MILIAYDGSEDAKAAIQHASHLMAGTAVTVLAIWEPFATMLARTPETLRPLAAGRDPGDIDRQEASAAEESAKQGATLARAAGLDATPLTTSLHGSVADTLINQADQLDVDAIVVSSRGLTGMSLLLGSVSLAVVQRADRPVVIVPTADAPKNRQSGRDK